MFGWASTALAAVALAWVAAADEGGRAAAPLAPEVCELHGADRARTSSMSCMACHDGGAGPFVEFRMGPGGMSHPVEVDYAAAAARRPNRYRPVAELPREVPLVAGKVACTSCHDGASPDPKHVAIPPRLCESCHRM